MIHKKFSVKEQEILQVSFNPSCKIQDGLNDPCKISFFSIQVINLFSQHGMYLYFLPFPGSEMVKSVIYDYSENKHLKQSSLIGVKST